ncbi:DUF3306 domain-containing protein [Thalassococcus lentus]|uniref:DUF3306 domain-containing protein n=1 Tax=Thalassococcus lentus TaxID=1210524 RepID=A0ABT4XXH8_9RHOB|nr:DUF3306 domain-containing protein [Thalassococcus lentus]MDA7426681.1 DUF3306 domain-containing protein [Thalassococcus lentus]
MASFWERRRAAVEAEERAEQDALAQAEAQAREAALEEKTDEELLTELELDAPETLDSPEELRKFLTDAVPQRLKTRALRRMWRLNPVLANLDGLVDYGEDFTDSANVVENMQTAYQVGKGMLKHVEEMARQAEEKAKALAAANDPEAETEAENTEELPVEDTAEDLIAEGPEETPAPIVTTMTAPPVLMDDESEGVPRRRMTFTFDDATA